MTRAPPSLSLQAKCWPGLQSSWVPAGRVPSHALARLLPIFRFSFTSGDRHVSLSAWLLNVAASSSRERALTEDRRERQTARELKMEHWFLVTASQKGHPSCVHWTWASDSSLVFRRRDSMKTGTPAGVLPGVTLTLLPAGAQHRLGSRSSSWDISLNNTVTSLWRSVSENASRNFIPSTSDLLDGKRIMSLLRAPATCFLLVT